MAELALGIVIGLAVGAALGFFLGRRTAARVGATHRPAPAMARGKIGSGRAEGGGQTAPSRPAAVTARGAVRVSLLDELREPPAAPAAAVDADALRQNLRLKCMYDEAKIDRLIQAERERTPGAGVEELMRAAVARWERDNR
jgi:hypothetical protein